LARTRKPETWYASRKLLIGVLSGCFFMPENVTRFQPPENVKKSLIRWTHIDIMLSRLPTFFHEEPKFYAELQTQLDGLRDLERKRSVAKHDASMAESDAARFGMIVLFIAAVMASILV